MSLGVFVENVAICFKKLGQFPYPQLALLVVYIVGMVAIALHGGLQ